MWLFTNFGFFSIVQKPEDVAGEMLTVRARVRKDLEALRDKVLPALGPIIENAGTDYPYRVRVDRAVFANALAKIALDIDYDNFKDSVGKEQGDAREGLYGEVWRTLRKLQKSEGLASPPVAKKQPAGAASKPKTSGGGSGVKMSYGGVVFDDAGKVLLREPKGHFGGYVWTFPKGRAHAGEPEEVAALREVGEETGYRAEILYPVPGPEEGYVGDVGRTRYFVMRPLPNPQKFGNETQAIAWLTEAEARERIRQTHHQTGRERDWAVLAAAVKAHHLHGGG